MSEQEKIISTLAELVKKNCSLTTSMDETKNEDDDADDVECIRKLTKNRYKLIYSMCQATKVMDYLESVGIIPRSVCSRILHQYPVPEDRKRELINFLLTRGKHAFKPLIEALYLAGNQHLVQLLDENFLLSNIRQQLDAEYHFPTLVGGQPTGPTSVEDEQLRRMNTNMESIDNKISVDDLNNIEVTKFEDEVPMGFEVQLLTADLIEQYPHLDPTRRSDKCYRMLSKPRGYCLLINNVDAFKTMEIRQGSDVDASKLKSLFEQLGFTVLPRRNLTYTEMINVIENFANLIEEKKDSCDCSVVIILSHGGNGTIYAVDELAVNIDEHIISVFDDHLIGKPKLFIIQACRGSQCNNRSIPSGSTNNNFWSSDSLPNETPRTIVDSSSHRSTMVPIRSDMAIWYSTVKDYVSWRSPDDGSIFIQSLITVFARTAWYYDLSRMVTCVNRTMDEKFAAHESTPFQTPCFECHLRHDLYFNPGCCSENR